ncbi:GGDEF domain-containing protein [Mycolicibacterium sp. CBMA 361]|uniref:GGDEF domain-containing protein n=1 Tax=Mycolicibacterium sp. CBMA 361 TaxID=2606610 RepID=UPI0012DDB046|nr:GGDEF domain-containing protein [Mycolicibacterium sp. CBMA 361]MUM34162.1 diguanylate cyclase [Mycolicibacterium sp. CBMA 361]
MRAHAAWSALISGVRFDEPLESEFQLSFNQFGRKSRHEMWAVLLVLITAGVIFHRTLLSVPAEVLPLGRTLLVAVAIPMVLRWLSGDHSPLQRWSSTLFVLSVYIDVACLMVLRIACIRHGLDVVPLAMPVAILMSLIVVQIRFLVLAPAMLAGLVGIVATELLAFETSSSRLFDIAASVGMATVALSVAYELERSTREAWLRARELARLTRTDPLTGIPNRRYFEDILVQSAQTARRSGQSLTVMALDLDDFKAFNDSNGHPAGDECLRRVADHLRRSMSGDGEFCARLGGEEFVAVWCASDPSEMAARAEDIRSGIAGLEITHHTAGRVVTASAGLAYDPAPVPSAIAATELLSQADSALYLAKRNGRDQLAVSKQPSGRSRTRRSSHPVGETRPGVPQPAALEPCQESEFRRVFERQGRPARVAIMVGLDIVCLVIMLTQQRVLKIPPEAVEFGVDTLVFGIMPAATVAAITALVPRLYRWSVPAFVVAVAVITSAQMFERVVQLPHGYDVVPYLMPTALLLSMCVVKIRFGVLAPSILAILALVSASAIELWAFPWTSNRLLTVMTTMLMVAVTTRFAHKLERSVRLAWLEERKLDELTRTDPLTGLANRRSFDEALDDTGGTRYAAVMILDLDDFKGFNDRYGHPAGDDALRAIGAYLREATADDDVVVARFGGEEFAALWRSPDEGGFSRKRRAEALRSGIAALGPLAGTTTTLTASAGFAEAALPAARQSARDLVQRADLALYRAKGQGRDRLVEIVLDAVDG